MNGTKKLLSAVGTTMRSNAMRTLLMALALMVSTSAIASQASAQEVQITGPLAGQPAVRHMRVYRAGRFNVMPNIAYTLQDEFARSLFIGLEANYHFLDWLGVGIWGAYNPADISTDLTSQITANGQTTDRNRLSLPSAGNFGQQIGHIRWGVSAHLIFVPLRGKLSLFQSVFVDTDLYIFAGIAIWGLEERAGVDSTGATACAMADPTTGQSSAACVATQTLRAGRVAPAPIFGIGLSLYANSWFGISLEWRATVFSWNPSGTDESGHDQHSQPGSGFPDGVIDGNDSRTTFTHMMQLGFTFNLPPEQSVTE
jgi:outer membrane beta-barrel protein